MKARKRYVEEFMWVNDLEAFTMNQLRNLCKVNGDSHMIYKAENPADQYINITDEINFWHSCRICGNMRDEMVSIYDQNGIDLQLEEKINNYLPITVAVDDDFPLFVCYICVEKVNTTHELVISCIKADERFKAYILQVECQNKANEDKIENLFQEEKIIIKENEDNDANELQHMKNENSNDGIMLLKYNGCRSERHSNSLDNTSCDISSQQPFILNDDVSMHENFANINLTKMNIMNCNSSETSDNLNLKSFENDDSLFSDNATFEAHLSNLTLDGDDTSPNNKVSLHLQEDIIKYSTENNFSQQVPSVVNIETESLDIYNCLPPISSVQTSKVVDDSLSVLENNLSAADVASELEEFCLMKHSKESNYNGNATTNITVIEGIDDDSSNDCEEDLLEDLPPGVILSCSDCGYITPSKVEMEAHSCQEELGQQPKFHCTDCNKSFSQQDSLQIHCLIHAEKPWSCRQCEQSFESRDTLSVHEIEKHSDSRSWLCDLCGKIFPHVMQLRIHRRAHVEVAQQMRRFRCEKCPRLFRNRFLLRTHMQEHNTEKPVMCEVCGLTFSDQKTLEQHSSFHNDAKAFECGICSLVFERKVGLTKHYKLHSEENIVACRICKATFPSVAGLLNHRKTHTPEEWESARQQCKTVPHSNRPQQFKSVPHTTSQPPSPKSYRCSRCSKLLSSKLSLSLHMRVHTGEKPFECLICNKRFTQKPALTYHMRLHTGERPHTCQFCGKGFNSKVGKESHERIHTGERPYRCGQCGVGFRCSANLRQHTWIHTDSRPFTCEICCKPFRRREALQVHMRTHTGERPYSCPLCGRCFTQKGDMLKHTRSHDRPGRGTVTPAAACNTCGQTFAQRKHFKAHRCLLGGPKNENDEVTIAPNDVISFPEITVVSSDMQDFEG